MSEKLSFIETLEPSSASAGPPSPVLRIRPQVVDSSVLFPDVVWASRTLCRTKFLSAVEFGSVRPFAAQHVWAEVPRKIEDEAAEMGFDRQLAESIWWDEYVPRIRFVDVHRLPIPKAQILQRDETDAPTLALAGLLGRAVVLAADTDIRDLGVAAPNWYEVIEAGHSLSVAGSSAWSSLVTMRLGGYALASAFRGAINMARHPLGQLVLSALVIGLFLSRARWAPRARHWLETVPPRLAAVVEAGASAIQPVVDDYRLATATWDRAVFDGPDTTLVQRVAQALATSPRPLSRTAMTRQLFPDASERVRREAMKAFGRLLAAYPAFVKVNVRDWQLGRPGIDFGRPEREHSLLTRRPVPRVSAGAPLTRVDREREAIRGRSTRREPPAHC